MNMDRTNDAASPSSRRRPLHSRSFFDDQRGAADFTPDYKNSRRLRAKVLPAISLSSRSDRIEAFLSLYRPAIDVQNSPSKTDKA